MSQSMDEEHQQRAPGGHDNDERKDSKGGTEPHDGHGQGGDNHGGDDHSGHHAQMLADFKRRFWLSLVLTIPVLLLSPMIQGWLGVAEAWDFAGDAWLQWALATAIFAYGGWPFLKGLFEELRDRNPGMRTLIALAIGVAYGYSSVVVFGVEGRVFFWELATLIDVMLLGHWVEMRSVMVITCPHALGLAIPLVVAVSTALAARNGLLVRDRSAFERARRLDAIGVLLSQAAGAVLMSLSTVIVAVNARLMRLGGD
jgi:cation transport ATPase